MTEKRDSRRFKGILATAISATVLLLAGCVAGNREIHPNRATSIRTIAVHPIEAPPLIVPSGFQLAMEKAGGIGESLGLLGVLIGGVVIAAKTGEIGDEARRFDKYSTDLEADEIWQPTQVVAEHVASYLRAQDRYQVDMLLPMTPLFGSDQKGWPDDYGPVRSWYNGSEPAAGSRFAKSDVVIEAGVWSYELAQGVLALAVVLRAVDPASGDVLGRARAIALPPARDLESLFANEAQGFKVLFTMTSETLTRQALGRLGL